MVGISVGGGVAATVIIAGTLTLNGEFGDARRGFCSGGDSGDGVGFE